MVPLEVVAGRDLKEQNNKNTNHCFHNKPEKEMGSNGRSNRDLTQPKKVKVRSSSSGGATSTWSLSRFSKAPGSCRLL